MKKESNIPTAIQNRIKPKTLRIGQDPFRYLVTEYVADLLRFVNFQKTGSIFGRNEVY